MSIVFYCERCRTTHPLLPLCTKDNLGLENAMTILTQVRIELEDNLSKVKEVENTLARIAEDLQNG